MMLYLAWLSLKLIYTAVGFEKLIYFFCFILNLKKKIEISSFFMNFFFFVINLLHNWFKKMQSKVQMKESNFYLSIFIHFVVG